MNGVRTIALLCVLTFLGINGFTKGNVGAFSWSSCGTADDVFMFYDVKVAPDPVVLPGYVSISMNFTATEAANAPIKLSVELQKKMDELWVDFPCVRNLGSCDYEDICVDLDRLFPPTEPCPDYFLLHNIPCNCPIQAGNYAIEDLTISLPTTEVDFVNGDFHLHFTLSSGATEFTCIDIYVTLSVQ